MTLTAYRLIMIGSASIILFLLFGIELTFAAAPGQSDLIQKQAHVLGDNCVLWLRSIEGRLPTGLFTQEDKTQYINEWEPYIGAVAVTNESTVGHVALVRGANKTHVLVEEANYIPGYVTIRGVPRDHILGYIVFDKNG